MLHRIQYMTSKISHSSVWIECSSSYNGSRLDGVDTWFDCHNQWLQSAYIMLLSWWVSTV